MGKIKGVIHCAGLNITETPAFVLKPADHMAAVLEPKVEGLQVLHRVFKRDRLEFFVLFSSVSGVIPGLATGSSDYAAANAYMDYFTGVQQHLGNTYYKSIQWPSWKETGMGEVKSPVL